MLLNARDRSMPRVSRRWSIAVMCLTVGLAVVLSGIGFAGQDAAPLGKQAAPLPQRGENPPLLVDPINPGFAAAKRRLDGLSWI